MKKSLLVIILIAGFLNVAATCSHRHNDGNMHKSKNHQNDSMHSE